MIRVFKTNLISQQFSDKELTQLVSDFKRYKETGIPAHYFGRDVPYDHPHTLPSVRMEELRHLHILESSTQKAPRRAQYYRTSDDHLVYCPGSNNSDHFLLISLLTPDAHEQSRDNNLMANMAVIAERFRQHY